MTKFLLTTAALLFVGSMAFADMKSVSVVMKKASAEDQKDLAKLLSQITLVPTKDAKTGKTIFRVTQVAEGSVYAREGIKVGDLVLQ